VHSDGDIINEEVIMLDIHSHLATQKVYIAPSSYIVTLV